MADRADLRLDRANSSLVGGRKSTRVSMLNSGGDMKDENGGRFRHFMFSGSSSLHISGSIGSDI